MTLTRGPAEELFLFGEFNKDFLENCTLRQAQGDKTLQVEDKSYFQSKPKSTSAGDFCSDSPGSWGRSVQFATTAGISEIP